MGDGRKFIFESHKWKSQFVQKFLFNFNIGLNFEDKTTLQQAGVAYHHRYLYHFARLSHTPAGCCPYYLEQRWANDNKDKEAKQDRANRILVSLLSGSFRNSSSLGDVFLKPLHLPISEAPWCSLLKWMQKNKEMTHNKATNQVYNRTGQASRHWSFSIQHPSVLQIRNSSGGNQFLFGRKICMTSLSNPKSRLSIATDSTI